MNSRVSVGVSAGTPSIGTSEPRIRSIGGEPAVTWRSDAHTSARAGDARDLGDRGEAAADLLEPVLAQAHHALVDRRMGDRLGGLAGDGERADRLRDPHDLVEADAAL